MKGWDIPIGEFAFEGSATTACASSLFSQDCNFLLTSVYFVIVML